VNIGIGIGLNRGRIHLPTDVAWEDLGVVATIAAQPTATGRIIAGLKQWNDRIYLSYGDYNTGTSTVQILAWNELTEAFVPTLGTFNSDGIHQGRIINNELWFPSVDPTSGTNGFIAKITPAHAYSQYTAPGVSCIHLFDCAVFNGQPMLIGSANITTPVVCDHGAAWRFNGTSWDLTLSEAPDACGVASPGYRAYTGFSIGSRFYTKTYSTGDTWYTDDGTNWFVAPVAIFGVSAGRAVEVNGGALVKTNNDPQGVGTQLYRYDGATNVMVTAFSNDHVKGPDGLVYSLWNLSAAVRKIQVATSPEATSFADLYYNTPLNGRSLCVTDDFFYIGTTDSHLWRLQR
jgi:hypothetical protein